MRNSRVGRGGRSEAEVLASGQTEIVLSVPLRRKKFYQYFWIAPNNNVVMLFPWIEGGEISRANTCQATAAYTSFFSDAPRILQEFIHDVEYDLGCLSRSSPSDPNLINQHESILEQLREYRAILVALAEHNRPDYRAALSRVMQQDTASCNMAAMRICPQDIDTLTKFDKVCFSIQRTGHFFSRLRAGLSTVFQQADDGVPKANFIASVTARLTSQGCAVPAGDDAFAQLKRDIEAMFQQSFPRADQISCATLVAPMPGVNFSSVSQYRNTMGLGNADLGDWVESIVNATLADPVFEAKDQRPFESLEGFGVEERRAQASLMLQFFLGVTNILCNARNKLKVNFGVAIEGNADIVNKIITQVGRGDLATLEDRLFDLVEKERAAFGVPAGWFHKTTLLTPELRKEIKEVFNRCWGEACVEKFPGDSPHYDEFLVMIKQLGGEFVADQGNMCSSFSHFLQAMFPEIYSDHEVFLNQRRLHSNPQSIDVIPERTQPRVGSVTVDAAMLVQCVAGERANLPAAVDLLLSDERVMAHSFIRHTLTGMCTANQHELYYLLGQAVRKEPRLPQHRVIPEFIERNKALFSVPEEDNWVVVRITGKGASNLYSAVCDAYGYGSALRHQLNTKNNVDNPDKLNYALSVLLRAYCREHVKESNFCGFDGYTAIVSQKGAVRLQTLFEKHKAEIYFSSNQVDCFFQQMLRTRFHIDTQAQDRVQLLSDVLLGLGFPLDVIRVTHEKDKNFYKVHNLTDKQAERLAAYCADLLAESELGEPDLVFSQARLAIEENELQRNFTEYAECMGGVGSINSWNPVGGGSLEIGKSRSTSLPAFADNDYEVLFQSGVVSRIRMKKNEDRERITDSRNYPDVTKGTQAWFDIIHRFNGYFYKPDPEVAVDVAALRAATVVDPVVPVLTSDTTSFPASSAHASAACAAAMNPAEALIAHKIQSHNLPPAGSHISLLMTGAMNPPHPMHIISVLRVAQELKHAGYQIDNIYLDPASIQYLKYKRKSSPKKYPSERELLLCHERMGWINIMLKYPLLWSDENHELLFNFAGIIQSTDIEQKIANDTAIGILREEDGWIEHTDVADYLQMQKPDSRVIYAAGADLWDHSMGEYKGCTTPVVRMPRTETGSLSSTAIYERDEAALAEARACFSLYDVLLASGLAGIEQAVSAERPLASKTPQTVGACAAVSIAESSSPILDATLKEVLQRPSYFGEYDNSKGLPNDADWYRAVTQEPTVMPAETIPVAVCQGLHSIQPGVVYGMDARVTSNNFNDAVITLASQFNACEAIAPEAPELRRYLHDKTQGPQAQLATPIAAVARIKKQPDLLEDVRGVGEQAKQFDEIFTYKYGYLMPKVQHLADCIDFMQKNIGALRINIDAALVYGDEKEGKDDRTITQVCCAAVAVAYTNPPAEAGQQKEQMNELCQIILDEQYKRMADIAIRKAQVTGRCVDLVLTGVGAGVFGNNPDVVAKSIKKAGNYSPLFINLT